MDDQLLDELMDGSEKICESCGSYLKVYKRKVHATIAQELINLYLAGGDEEFVHISKFFASAGCGDFSKAKHFGLLYKKPKDKNDIGKKASGYWRLSTAGVEFVLGEREIAKYVVMYQNKVIGYDDDIMVDIEDCLGDKFNYWELMNGS